MTQPSDPFTTVLALLKIWAGHSRDDIDEVDWRSVDWERVIAFASSHLVVTALAGPVRVLAQQGKISLDVANFLDQLRASNEARNGHLCRALISISAKLEDVRIDAIAMKGAAFLLDPHAEDISWRFMSDLDLLVPGDRLHEAVAALQGLGYTVAERDYDPIREAHYPPLIAPCGTFSVELHSRVFALGDFGLPPADVRQRAVSVHRDRMTLRIPCVTHRAIHVLSHAQLHNRNFAAQRLVLKDLLDLAALARLQPEINWRQLSTAYSEPYEQRAVRALLAAYHMSLATAPDRRQPLVVEELWARRALQRLQRTPRYPGWDVLLETIRLEWSRFRHEPGHLAYRLRQAISPGHLLFALHSRTFKARQRSWR